MYSEERAQTEVIGVILLIGISTMVIGGSIVVATGSINDFSLVAQSENGENSISHVEAEMSAVAIGDSENREVSFSRTSDGRYLLRPDSGQVSVTYTQSGTEEWNVTRPFGAIVYNSSDRDIAYQGGGVWSMEGDYTSIVSQPEFDYNGMTLTFPIIQVLEPGSDKVSVGYDNIPQSTKLESDRLDFPLENGTVKIEVTSRYYEGWYEYFQTQTETEANIYHDNNTATATLVPPKELQLDSAVTLAEEYNGKSKIISSDEVNENNPQPSADPLIDSELSAAETTNDNGNHACISDTEISGSCTLTAGTYYIDSDVTLDKKLTLDVSGGNITIAVNGTFDTGSNSVSVEGHTDNQVSYYISDDLQLQGGADVTHASGGSSLQNQFFVGDQFTEDNSNTNGIFEGIVYAPESDTDEGGNFEIEGALILKSLSMNGGAASITRGDIPPETVIDVTGVADTIEFMHVTTNRVRVSMENNDLILNSYSIDSSNNEIDGCQDVKNNIDSNGNYDGSNLKAKCDIVDDLDGYPSDVKIDIDTQSVLIGDINTEADVDIDKSHIDGDVEIGENANDLTVTNKAIIEGDVVISKNTNGDVDGGSVIKGDLVQKLGGSLSMDGVTVEGHLYVNEDDWSCSNSEIGPEKRSCSEYQPRSPSEYN